jgi:hypothetical protein
MTGQAKRMDFFQLFILKINNEKKAATLCGNQQINDLKSHFAVCCIYFSDTTCSAGQPVLASQTGLARLSERKRQQTAMQ